MKLNKKKIDNAILQLIRLREDFAKEDTIFISAELDECINRIGWRYAQLVETEKRL